MPARSSAPETGDWCKIRHSISRAETAESSDFGSIHFRFRVGRRRGRRRLQATQGSRNSCVISSCNMHIYYFHKYRFILITNPGENCGWQLFTWNSVSQCALDRAPIRSLFSRVCTIIFKNELQDKVYFEIYLRDRLTSPSRI